MQIAAAQRLTHPGFATPPKEGIPLSFPSPEGCPKGGVGLGNTQSSIRHRTSKHCERRARAISCPAWAKLPYYGI